MYTVSEAESFKLQAQELGLKYPQKFMQLTGDKISQIANGYGPDNWSNELRSFVSWLFRNYPLPAVIHDIRYEFSDGSELTRKAADTEFSANLKIVWQHHFAWQRFINPLAWYDLWKINTAVNLTYKFGKTAWRNAWHRNQKTKEQDHE